MKNYALLFLVVVIIVPFNCFAQRSDRVPVTAKFENTQLTVSNNELVVVSYHVEERINMAFGGSITTYDVPQLSLVSTIDLGPNNTRVVTPRYGKAKITAVKNEQLKASLFIITTALKPITVDMTTLEGKKRYVTIDIINTYERVLEKGYQSVDMLKRVSNNRYFHGDLTTAAKWYSQLFAITTDLEAEYYYRYALSLTSISEIEKANEMMVIFEKKSKNSQP